MFSKPIFVYLLGSGKASCIYLSKFFDQGKLAFFRPGAKSFTTFYTLGRFKIKSLNCCLNDQEKCNPASMLGCCVQRLRPTKVCASTCCYPSTRIWLKDNRSCHTSDQSYVNNCSLINTINLYKVKIRSFVCLLSQTLRSPTRQTG